MFGACGLAVAVDSRLEDVKGRSPGLFAGADGVLLEPEALIVEVFALREGSNSGFILISCVEGNGAAGGETRWGDS